MKQPIVTIEETIPTSRKEKFQQAYAAFAASQAKEAESFSLPQPKYLPWGYRSVQC